AVPHVVGPASGEEQLRSVAGLRSLAEDVLAAVRAEVAEAAGVALLAELDRAEREFPSQSQRRVAGERLVDILLDLRRRVAVVRRPRVESEHRLEFQAWPYGVRRPQRDRDRQLPVVEVDGVHLLVVEDAVDESGRDVRIVVGAALPRRGGN